MNAEVGDTMVTDILEIVIVSRTPTSESMVLK